MEVKDIMQQENKKEDEKSPQLPNKSDFQGHKL